MEENIETIEVVFIEYKLSSLPYCKSPIMQLGPPLLHIVQLEEELMDHIDHYTDDFELMYLTPGLVAKQYGHLSAHSFPKMCKLHFLQKLKLSEGKPIVVFAPLEVIDQLGSEFVSEYSLKSDADDGLCIRKIRCIAYLHEEQRLEKYYMTFKNENCPIGGLSYFAHVNIALLSPTALT